MKEKINEDIPPYLIWAHAPEDGVRAMGGRSAIGLLLPCNVIVRRRAEN